MTRCSVEPDTVMHTIHSALKRFMGLAAIAGIVAFLSFPAAPGARSGSGVFHWLATLVT